MTKNDIILLLLFADARAPIVGTTRLQKLLFLVENEKNIRAENESFAFEAFKFGPASKALYDDLEFLINIDFLERTGENSNINNYSLDEIDDIDAKDLLGYESEVNESKEGLEESYEKTSGDDLIVYRITDKGINYLKENSLVNNTEAIEIESIKKRYGKKSLVELLKYVYIKYPNYTTESIIKDELL